MPMTKQDFIALADVMRELEPLRLDQKDARASNEHRQWEQTVERLAEFCAKQNSHFMYERWMAYIRCETDIRKPLRK